MPAPPFLPSAFSMVPSVMLMVTAPFLLSFLVSPLPLPMPAPPYLPPVALTIWALSLMLMVVVPAFRPAPMPAPLYQRLELDTYSPPPVAFSMLPPVMLMVTAPFLLSGVLPL